MIIADDNSDGIASLKFELACCLAMKDLSILRYFLGIEVAYSPKSYLLLQSKYISNLFECARLTNNRIVDTPIETNVRYAPSDRPPLLDPSLFRTIVGSLVYFTVTRPDIVYAVYVVSQFIAAPIIVHWVIVLHILRYLQSTQFQNLLFPSTSYLELRAYSDVNWDDDPMDYKSTTGFCVFLGDSLILLKSKKQDVISRSYIKTEYNVMTSTTCKIVWLRSLLTDMCISLHQPTLLYYDNQSVIRIARNSVFHKPTKHIKIDYDITRYHLQIITIILSFVS
ncbi:uncharacterized mitochondrial protein AtMg00810-like [Zingiber officinale]|uniref:uncharacterized mitochondrial protein AtMg00810-like n=1 Tax=Zingiber officinale TaxID=94328 RepID=UPI001C4C6059|nr:uncharacterized mitochondrial protein AtMg00810-like [Zingiber officinale]